MQNTTNSQQQPQKSKKSRQSKAARRLTNRSKRIARETPTVGLGRAMAKMNLYNSFGEQPAYQRALIKGRSLTALLATPHDATLERMPTVDMPKVALLRFRDSFSILSGQSSSMPPFAPGTVVANLYGQPGRLIEFGPVTTPANGIYNAQFAAASATAVTTDWTILGSAIGGSYPPTMNWPLQGFMNYSGASYAGQKYRAVGVSLDKKFIFLSGADQMSISAATGTSTIVGTWNFEVHKWTAEGQHRLFASIQVPSVAGLPTVGAGLVSAAINGEGYYSITFVGVTATAGVTTTPISIQINITLNNLVTPFYQQRYINDIAVDPSIAQDVRRTACSLLLTNTSAFNIRQGNVIAARVEDFNLGVAATVAVNPLENTQDKYQGDAANGVYTYMEFSDESAKFRDAVTASGCPMYNLDITDFSNLVTITGTAGSQNTFLAAIDTVVEFKVDNQRYPMHTSMLGHDLLVEARRIANSTPWFFENPNHISDIIKWINQAWNRTRQNADLIGNVAAAAFPQYSVPIRTVVGMLKK